MPYPLGIDTKTVIGHYAEVYYDKIFGQYMQRPKNGFVYVYPAVTELLIDDTIIDLSELSPQRVPVDSNGDFSIEVIVTDQVGLEPNNGWTYRFKPSWNESDSYIAPTSGLTSPIQMADYFEATPVNGVITTRGNDGRGVVTITADGTIATVFYTDSTTSTFDLPVGEGGTGGTATPDATSTLKGKLRLTNDLAGTADAPQVSTAIKSSLTKADTAVQPAGLTKAAVGLSNVDNVSDINKPVSNATQTALNLKVNISNLHAVATSGSYTDLNNKPTIPATKADIGLGNVDNTTDLNKPVSTLVQAALDGKSAVGHTHTIVNVTGLQTALDAKSNVGHTHAEYVKSVNDTLPDVNGNVVIATDVGSVDWSTITNRPTTFPPDTHTHVWADITDKPTTFVPAAHTHTIANVTGLQAALDAKSDISHTHAWTDITSKPSTFAPAAHTHIIADTTGLQAALDSKAGTAHLHDDRYIRTVNDIGPDVNGNVIITVGSSDWADITNKPSTFAPAAHNHPSTAISDSTTLGRTLITIADAASARTAIGAGTSNLTIGTTGSTAMAGNTIFTKSDVGLANVDNTSDVNKPISSATQTALNGKSNTGHVHTQYVQSVNDELPDENGNVVIATDVGSVDWATITGKPATFAPTIGTTSVTAKAGNYVPDWTELTNKPVTFAPAAHNHPATDINDSTVVGRSLITAVDAAAARIAIGAGTSSLIIGTSNSTAKAGDYAPTWTEVTSKPTTFTPSAHTHLWADITDKPTTFTPSAHTHAAVDISNSTTTGRSVLTAADAAAARTAIGAGTSSLALGTTGTTAKAGDYVPAWGEITSKPTTFTPDTHVHAESDITNLTTDLNNKQPLDSDLTAFAALSPTNDDIVQRKAGAWTNRTIAQLKTDLGLVKADVGLGSVDNTADAAKNVLSATKLTTARNINGVSFDGTANITIVDATKEPTLTAGTTAQYYRGDKSWQTLNAAAIGDSTVTGRSLITATDAAAARTAIGAGTSNLTIGTTGSTAKVGNYVPDWTEITSKPTISGSNTGDQTITLTGEVTGSGTGSFAATIANAAVIGKVLTGYTSGSGTVAATDTILQAIQKLNGNDTLKAPIASPTFTGTVSGITKTMVGLGSVDNTADAAKAVLSATKLTTARNINGVSFDGTANITVTDNTKATTVALNKAARYDPKHLPILYSWFGNLSNGAAPATFDTGQAASSAPGAVAPTIDTGRLIASGTGVRASYYRSAALGSTVTRVGGRFSFRPGTATRTGGGTAAVAISAAPIDITSGVNTNMSCHFHTTATSWVYSVWTNGVGEVVLATGSYATPLTVDSATEYEMNCWINGSTATIELPDGYRTTVTDARINTYAGQYAYFESYLPNGNTDDMAAFSHVWADTGTSIPAEPQFVHKSGAEDIRGFKAFMDGLYSTGTVIGGTFQYLLSPGAGKVLTSDGAGIASWQTLTSSAVGLGNVNNTSDASKPVSTAQQTALDAKVNIANGMPSDFVYEELSPVTARSIGGTDRQVGMYVGRAFTATKIIYQFDTADASGNTVVELRRNGSQVASSNLTISAANQADGTGTDAARSATINQSFAVGDRLELQITGVGTTPGKGVKAYIVGTWN